MLLIKELYRKNTLSEVRCCKIVTCGRFRHTSLLLFDSWFLICWLTVVIALSQVLIVSLPTVCWGDAANARLDACSCNDLGFRDRVLVVKKVSVVKKALIEMLHEFVICIWLLKGTFGRFVQGGYLVCKVYCSKIVNVWSHRFISIIL